MSLKIYCSICGNPSEYTISKPKFCQGCGKPFGAALPEPKAKNLPLRKAAKAKYVHTEEDYEDEDSEDTIEEIPQIDKIQISIAGLPEVHRRENEDRQTARARIGLGIKFDDIIPNPNPIPDVPRVIDKTISPQQVLAQLKKESQSSRQSVEVGE